jgi:hypothetical protein
MSPLRTRTGSNTAKDPSSFIMGSVSDGQSGPSRHARPVGSESLPLRTTQQRQRHQVFTVTTTQDRWTLHSSQDGDALANSSTCYDFARIRAAAIADSKSSASMTQAPTLGRLSQKYLRFNLIYPSTKIEHGRGFSVGPTTTTKLP